MRSSVCEAFNVDVIQCLGMIDHRSINPRTGATAAVPQALE